MVITVHVKLLMIYSSRSALIFPEIAFPAVHLSRVSYVGTRISAHLMEAADVRSTGCVTFRQLDQNTSYFYADCPLLPAFFQYATFSIPRGLSFRGLLVFVRHLPLSFFVLIVDLSTIEKFIIFKMASAKPNIQKFP